MQSLIDDLLRLIEVMLMKNKFVFEEDHYLQIHGMAVGTQMYPAYINIF